MNGPRSPTVESANFDNRASWMEFLGGAAKEDENLEDDEDAWKEVHAEE